MASDSHSVSRRSFLSAAALGGAAVAVGGLGASAAADPLAELPPAYEGDLLSVTADRLVLVTPQGEELRIPVSSRTSVWLGGQSTLDKLRPGQDIAIGLDESGLGDRLWADITRVKGAITGTSGTVLEVDPGNGKQPQVLDVPASARAELAADGYSRWEPGYLVDIIGHRNSGVAVAMSAAATQPGYHVEQLAAAIEDDQSYPDVAKPRQINGKITWFNDASCRCDSTCRGNNAHTAWPMLERCNYMPARCQKVPYLACGRKLTVHNKCTKKSLVVKVIDCGPDNRRFCDTCRKCGTSRKGRIADLTRPTYIRIGGSLNAGCFTGWVKV
nr:hypothetical protein [Kibdelosporangium sp. MJ126-NF4]CEL18113.1 hypothetical protein [Kibdelosporangium sp. MJ126-NF4]CTQ90658.1 hypothetical protein [Kibdelosporangium sp. MJ126-NF4]